VLGFDGEPVENRLARGGREELKSAEEAKKNAGRLFNKEHPEYRRVAEDFRRCSREIEDVFSGGWTTGGDGRRLLHGQSLPGPEDSVAWLLSEFLSRPQTRDVGRDTYGYISNLSHPTLYRISGMWSIDEWSRAAHMLGTAQLRRSSRSRPSSTPSSMLRAVASWLCAEAPD